MFWCSGSTTTLLTTCEYVTLHGQRGFAGAFGVERLSWANWADFLLSQRLYKRTAEASEPERMCDQWRDPTDVGLCAREAGSLYSYGRKGTGFLLEPREGIQCCWVISDLWPPQLQGNKFVLFEASAWVAACYSSHGKLIHSAAGDVTDKGKASFLNQLLIAPNPEEKEVLLFHAGSLNSKTTKHWNKSRHKMEGWKGWVGS